MRYYCSECRETITENVYNFSKTKYGKALCMAHQRTITPPPATRFQNDRQYFCSICKESISSQVYEYSTRNLGAPLCIHHQKTVTPEAIKLSKALTDLEVKHQLEAYDGYKHVDISIESAKLYIELEGSQHGLSSKQMLADDDRDRHSSKSGYLTKRIPNSWVNQNPHRLANSIRTLAEKRERGIKEEESKLTVTGAVTGIVKTMIKTAQKLSEKLDDFE
jgi:very-short-patch-repair endonuclease